MNIFDAIHQRRSIRKYTDQPVTEEQISTILEAAMMAPSAGNAQPWQFVVVRDKAALVGASPAHDIAVLKIGVGFKRPPQACNGSGWRSFKPTASAKSGSMRIHAQQIKR